MLFCKHYFRFLNNWGQNRENYLVSKIKKKPPRREAEEDQGFTLCRLLRLLRISIT